MTVIPKIISEKDGLVDYVASNETLDSYNEVISAKGWRFTRFAKNAPFVNSHRYYSIADQLGELSPDQLAELVEVLRSRLPDLADLGRSDSPSDADDAAPPANRAAGAGENDVHLFCLPQEPALSRRAHPT
jgi:hypothetical protein